MITGPNFIWLHFPKCAGTSVERALFAQYGGRRDFRFDPVGPDSRMIWHDTINERKKRNLSFAVGNRKIIACIRRLPAWILSRVHFEASRPPHLLASRDMIVSGRFFEQDGFVNHADSYVAKYDNPRVDHWIRTEHLTEDLAKIGIPVNLPHENRTAYSDELDTDEIQQLYESCPLWAELERHVYGNVWQGIIRRCRRNRALGG